MFDKERELARSRMNGNCKACDICNGIACLRKIPGPGGKGEGKVVINNYEDWNDYQLLMDNIGEVDNIETKVSLFNKEINAPIIAGPVGAVSMHYGDYLNDYKYNKIIAEAANNKELLYMVGDGKDDQIMIDNLKVINKFNNNGIVTLKPWKNSDLQDKLTLIKKNNPLAVAMDIDSIGLPFLKDSGANNKSVTELKAIKDSLDCPFIIKGVNSVKGALKAIEANADAIIVSNHGGRVLDGVCSSAKVLKDIVDVCDKKIKVLVDGGIRDGKTIFKALALGADAVVIARPMVVSAYGDYSENYMQYLVDDLKDVMKMCGVNKIEDINENMLIKVK